MNDIEQLSRKLINNNVFKNEIKQLFDKLYEQKNSRKQSDDFIRPRQQSLGFKLNQKCIEQDQLNIIQGRYSVSSSVFSKRQSRDSISSMTSNPLLNQYMNSNSSYFSLNQITNQITNLIDQLIKKQCSMSNRVSINNINTVNNTQTFSQLIQKMEAIQKQHINNLKINLQQKIQTLKTSVQSQVLQIIQKIKNQRKNKKIVEKASQIKKQRRKVTQSILDISKNNHEMSTFSNMYDMQNILSQSEDEQNFVKRSSPQLSHLSQKISEVQKSQSKISKQFENKFAKQVQQNSKDIEQLTQRIIQYKMKTQQKLENGFTGVWNVVSDIEDKMNKVNLRVVQLQHALTMTG